MDTRNNKSRRNFIKNSVIAGTLLPLMSNDLFADLLRSKNAPAALNVSVFSKDLQFLNYKDMADAAAEIGFNGIDLTVRPKGHVLPKRVEMDLPKAIV